VDNWEGEGGKNEAKGAPVQREKKGKGKKEGLFSKKPPPQPNAQGEGKKKGIDVLKKTKGKKKGPKVSRKKKGRFRPSPLGKGGGNGP